MRRERQRGREPPVQPLGRNLGFLDRRQRHQQGELVATHAAETILAPQRRPPLDPETLQHQVAGFVAVAVVHALEAVKVEKGQ